MDPQETSDSKVIVTTTSADNYFSEQALRAGLLSGDIKRSELTMGTDPLREVIQREIEKERIREEIIASEFMRRRELEAEVRRELALERDLGLRRGDGFSLVPTSSSSPSMWSEPRFLDRSHGHVFGLPERVSFPTRTEVGPFERVPFQRNPDALKIAESNKGQAGKVVIFAKPVTSNLTGTKRKILSMDSADDSNMMIIPKKKAQEYSCALCEVSATSEHGLNMHLQGKKHKAKEAKKNKGTPKSTENSNTPKDNNGNSPALKKNKKLELQARKKLSAPDSKKRLFAFWCADCQVGCHSECVMNAHCKGKKHLLKMEELKKTNDTASPTKICADTVCGKDASQVQDDRENVDGEVGETEGKEEATMESVVDAEAES